MTQVISKLLHSIEFYEAPTFLVSRTKKEFVVRGCNSKMNVFFKAESDLDTTTDLGVFCSEYLSISSKSYKELLNKISDLYEHKISDPYLEFYFKEKNFDFKIKLERLNAEEQNLILVQLFNSKKRKMFNSEHQQTQLYEKLFQSLPIGVAVSRIDDNTTVFANQKLEEIYGWPIENIQNVSEFFERVYPDKDYREKISRMILDDIASKDPEQMNWNHITITTKQGQKKIVNAKNIPLYDENLMISTVTDFTDMFKIQEDLEVAYKRLDRAFKATSDALWEWELCEDELYWGDGYGRLFGYDIEKNKVSKAFWESKIHPSDSDPFFNSLNAALKDKSTNKWSFIYRFKNSEGEYANVRENIIIIRDDDGSPIRLVGAIQDITKAIKRENHLNLLEKIVGNAKDAIMVTKVESNSFLESKIVYANPSTQSLFGTAVKEIIGKTSKSFYVTPNNEHVFLDIEERLSQWESVDIDVLSLTRDRTEFWNKLFVSPIMDEEGWYTHWMIVNRNVNDERTITEKQDLLTFTHKAFQDEEPLENSFCKVALKMESLFRTIQTEFWIKDAESEKLEKCFRFKNGERLPVTLGQKTSKHREFIISVLNSNDPAMSAHKNEVDDKVKQHYAIQIMDQDKSLGVVSLGFPDTYSEKTTLDKIFKEFSMQLGAELSRKLTEFRISSFFSNTPDILFIIKKDDRIRRINKRAEHILGYKKDEFVDTHVTDFIIEDHRQSVNQMIGKARKEKGYISKEVAVKAKDGSILNLDWTVFNLKESKDVFCVARDISKYKENLSNLKTQIQKFRIINETVKDAIWDYDLERNKIEWGDGLKESFGYDPANFGVSEEVWARKIHPDDRQRVLDSLKASQFDKNKNDWRYEYRFKKKKGTYAEVLDRGVIIRNENEEVIRMVGSMQDISEFKAYSKELEKLNSKLEMQKLSLVKSNQDLEEFAYVTSHDLIEPLRMVTVFLTRLEDKYADSLDKTAMEYINFAVDGAKQMKFKIEGLLHYSKVGAEPPDFGEVSLSLILKEVKAVLHDKLTTRKVSIETDELPKIYSIKTDLKEIFLNLIDNAIKFSKQDVEAKINITYREDAQNHFLMFKDNGIGISEEFHKKIFGIFQRLHSQSEYPGSGIGLAIVKKSVHNLGGHIEISSKLGSGSIFQVVLPKKK